jgi:tRNA(Arg) A34 adenosine deaminase TadA
MDRDTTALREAFRLAERSVEHGDYPFAALLLDAGGRTLVSSEQRISRTGNWLGHAELLLLEDAASRWSREALAGATVYSSTEPCPMCTGAIAWSVNRLVFGLSQAEMYRRFTCDALPAPRFVEAWDCRKVLDRLAPPMEVIGPMLEDEAAQAHAIWMDRWVPGWR